jgi:hypothetical protein
MTEQNKSSEARLTSVLACGFAPPGTTAWLGWEAWRWVPIQNASWSQATNGSFLVDIQGVIDGDHRDWVSETLEKFMSGVEFGAIWGGRLMAICAQVGRHLDILGQWIDHDPSQLTHYLLTDPLVVRRKLPLSDVPFMFSEVDIVVSDVIPSPDEG